MAAIVVAIALSLRFDRKFVAVLQNPAECRLFFCKGIFDGMVCHRFSFLPSTTVITCAAGDFEKRNRLLLRAKPVKQ